MLEGTPGFQQRILKDIGNVGRHIRISPDNAKRYGKCWWGYLDFSRQS